MAIINDTTRAGVQGGVNFTTTDPGVMSIESTYYRSSQESAFGYQPTITDMTGDTTPVSVLENTPKPVNSFPLGLLVLFGISIFLMKGS